MSRSSDLDRVILQVKRRAAWTHRGTEPGVLLPEHGHNPCEFVMTDAGRAPDRIAVRCRCMATYRSSPRHFGYDTLGTVTTFEAALQLWYEHRKAVCQP